MSSVPLEITITGIQGNDSQGGALSPLYIPIEAESDYSFGFAQPTADKIGNDPETDVFVLLSNWALIGKDGLIQGAWKKDKDLNTATYDEPMYTKATSSTLVQPLAWTLNKNAPLMPGCGLVEANGSYAFSQFVRFKDDTNNRLYALDVKSNKVYYDNAGTWTDTSASGSGNVTELKLYGKNDTNKRLYLGRDSGNAYYYNGTAWNDASYAAQHFLQVGKNWFYADGNRLKKDATSANALDIRIGYKQHDIAALEWFNTHIVVGKPEGLWVVDPVSKIAQDIITFPNQDADNCRFVVLHNGSLFFPGGEILYELTSGFDLIRHRPATFDGWSAKTFVGGKVVWAHSDGNILWLCYKVTTQTTYDYFLIAYTGASGGFHPVHVVSVLQANDPAYTAGGIFFLNNKLYYSFGNDKTGYLLTDGTQPLCDTGSGVYFTKNVGLWLGWFDVNRDFASKWFKQLRVSLGDYGGTGQLRAYYKKWTDTSAMTFPSDVTGAQDNASMTPTAEGSNVAGFTTTKVNVGLELRNTAASPASAWYLKRAHLVGSVTYTRGYLASFSALLDFDNKTEHRVSGRTYNAQRIFEGLLAAYSQAAPVIVTLPNSITFTGRLETGANGVQIIDARKDANAARREKMSVMVREYT